jgi:uncharacterized membrane protein YheB (UPF0754 family)
MSVWLFIIVNVVVAGTVGGVTNYLAIKMLFHPRKPLVVFGRRLPFTPGLIPKRKQEIAASLGGVVADYLVTPGAMQELFGKSEFRSAMLSRIYSWVKREIGESATVGDCIRRWAGEEKSENMLAALPEQAGKWTGQAFVRLWERGNWGERRIREIIPGWGPQAAAQWADLAARWGLDAVKSRLLSAEGQALLRNLASGLLERQGGFLGMLAGIFVDEDKLVARLTPFLAEQLESAQVRAQISEWLSGQILEIGEMTLGEALGKMGLKGAHPEQQAKQWIQNQLPWEQWAGKLEQLPVGRWLAEREETWQRWIQAAFDSALDLVSRYAPRMMEALQLRDMVRIQVERFPVDQLEQVILSISGREFRAITWLGVLLGSMIGLIQSILIRLWPGG